MFTEPWFFEKKVFKGFLHKMCMATILVNGRNHLTNFEFPQPLKATYEIWLQLAWGFKMKSFENVYLDIDIVNKLSVPNTVLKNFNNSQKKKKGIFNFFPI